jgi:hypothetical protein
MSVLEIVLWGAGLVTCSGLAAYGMLVFRRHRAAEQWTCCDPSDDDLADLSVHTRETPATGKNRPGSGVRAGLDASPHPMDAWVDDALRHKLDDL